MKEYLNSTKSLRLEEGVYYSYRTPVAFVEHGFLRMTDQKFSVTTGRHKVQIRKHTGYPVEWYGPEEFKEALDLFQHSSILTPVQQTR